MLILRMQIVEDQIDDKSLGFVRLIIFTVLPGLVINLTETHRHDRNLPVGVVLCIFSPIHERRHLVMQTWEINSIQTSKHL